MCHRLFSTFKAPVDGFVYYKPIVQVDGTVLYEKYKWTLLVVVTQDGASLILSIVFALVEDKTMEAWSFFVQNLKRHVAKQQGICLTSDMHISIISAYKKHDSRWTPDNSVHVNCIRHIVQNFMRHFNRLGLRKNVISMGKFHNQRIIIFY